MNSNAKGRLLSFGHGYSARALAASLPGWEVIGTHRDAPLRWPGTDMRPYLDGADHLLISIAPGAAAPDDPSGGDPVLAELGDEIAARAGRYRWVGYLSTTGVYGDRGGDWVDETSALRPSTERGRRRVAAEAAWRAIPGLPLHIFRLAGIYGPGRGPFAKVRAGTARRIIKPGQVFSRIHVQDIAASLAASIARPDPGAIYNLCDDDPAPPEAVIAAAATLLRQPVPPAEDFATADMTPMARSFYAENKRVSNRRIKEDLGVVLKFPTYRDGLADLVRREDVG